MISLFALFLPYYILECFFIFWESLGYKKLLFAVPRTHFDKRIDFNFEFPTNFPKNEIVYGALEKSFPFVLNQPSTKDM